MKPSASTPAIVSNLQGQIVDLPNGLTIVCYDDQCAGEFMTSDEWAEIKPMLSADSKTLIAAGIKHRISRGDENAIPCIHLL